MATIHEVQAAMERHWPTGMPSWPDPHAVGDLPADEEYSRVTDGPRYRIVVERARAWTAACAEVLGAQVTPLASTGEKPHDDREGWIITSSRPGTAPLRVAVFDMDFPAIMLGCGDAHDIERFPDCGCDACDPGSESLLVNIDDWFVNALTGVLAHIWGEQWSATHHEIGISSGGATSASVQLTFEEAGRQLAAISAGGTPELPAGLHWVWSGHWTD